MTVTIQPGLFEAPAPPSAPVASSAKAGPKAQAELSPLPRDAELTGVDALAHFMARYIIVPRGQGAGKPMELRPWQRSMCQGHYRPDNALSVWVLPRGQGKSGIAAAIALERLFRAGSIGTRIAIVAQDERSAIRLLKTASRMVELSPDLAARTTIYRDRLVVPGTDAELTALPAEAHRVEGSDLDLAILDEIGFMPSSTFEAAVLSVGKVEGGKVLAIGTPSPAKFRDISPLYNLVLRGRAGDGSDTSFDLVEYGAPADLDIYAPETWRMANPAMDDGWLTEKSIRAQLPPTTREAEFRRARLGQWVESATEPAFTAEHWKARGRPGVAIPKGARVVLALDGSASRDSTAIIVGSISKTPHFQVGGLWEPSREADDYEVSHLEVEDRIIQLAEFYDVVEVVADPFRWQRSLQVLEERGLPVAQFPQTTARLTPATNDARAAVAEGGLTHDADERLSTHVLRASIEETTRGLRLAKPTKHEKIDLAACLIMALSRCQWLGDKRHSRKRKVKGFKK